MIGLPLAFDPLPSDVKTESDSNSSSSSVEHQVNEELLQVSHLDTETFTAFDPLPDDERKLILEAVQELSAVNESRPLGSITHPKAIVSINTGDAVPVAKRQHPMSDAAMQFVDDWIQSVLREEVIEEGDQRAVWIMPLVLALEKRHKRLASSSTSSGPQPADQASILLSEALQSSSTTALPSATPIQPLNLWRILKVGLKNIGKRILQLLYRPYPKRSEWLSHSNSNLNVLQMPVSASMPGL